MPMPKSVPLRCHSKTSRSTFIIAVVFLTQLGFVEKHTAFKRPPFLPMTDLGTFLRVGWAVRTGEDIYQVTDWHGWHYNFQTVFPLTIVRTARPFSFQPSNGELREAD